MKNKTAFTHKRAFIDGVKTGQELGKTESCERLIATRST